MTGSQAFRKALLRVHDGVTGSSKTLLKGNKIGSLQTTGNCAICTLLKIDVTKFLNVVKSD